ncbi:membrane protein [Caballeronia udeis]|uniref:Membrane protein n=2 Tax=Caballeronia udeis TaxID=1232866 RepID=A0A158JUI5_9BURK|nr:membrane protein [Caballeronia udeis]
MNTTKTTANMATAFRKADKGKAVAATVIGTALEVFDFSSYSFFSVTIGKLFFPTHDPVLSLLLAALTFGVGFFVRPLGGIVLGIYGDRVGRKQALSLSIMLMALGIAIVACAPTYQQIGVGATILLVVGRLIQGFAHGGEMGTAATFLSEYAPANSRGLYASYIQSSIGFAVLAGAGVGVFISSELSQEALESWGWRIPFALGLLIGPVGWFIRRGLDETPTFKHTAKSNTPLREVIRDYPRQTFSTISLVILWTVCTYVLLYYMPTFVVKSLGLPQGLGFRAGLIGGAVILVASPMFGWLSDRIGRRFIVASSALLIGVLAFPMFAYIVRSPSLTSLVLFQLVFGVLISAYTAPILAVFAEMFPSRVRSTGLSLAYNVAVTIFGGFATFVITLLIAWSGSKLAPAGYVAFAALLSFLGAVVYPKPLDDF